MNARTYQNIDCTVAISFHNGVLTCIGAAELDEVVRGCDDAGAPEPAKGAEAAKGCAPLFPEGDDTLPLLFITRSFVLYKFLN
jgi:hypothetical protein